MCVSAERRGLREVGSACGIAAFAIVTPWLARLSLDCLDRLLEPSCNRPHASAEHIVDISTRIDQVLETAAPIVGRGCLPRGLTRYYFLRRAGAQVSLCFGIAVGRQAVGHCWLEMDDKPVFEARDPRSTFVEMYRLPHRP
jgi:hypothetical protein